MNTPTDTAELARHIDNGTLFQALNTPYIVFGVDDPDFTILEENAAHADVAMVTRARTVGRPLFDVFPDTSEAYIETGHSELLESIRKVIRTGKPDQLANLSYSIKDPTGTFEQRYWSVTHYPVKGKSGRVIAVCQETRDITDRVVMGRQLERTQHQLDQLLVSSMMGTYEWSVVDDRVYADGNLADMFGLSLASLQDGVSLKRFISAVHPKDRGRVERVIGEALDGDKAYESEYRTVVDGTVRWVIARGYVQRDDNGTPLTFSGVVVDITDRKEAELALVNNESKLRLMINSLPQLAWITRPDGYHEYYNRQWHTYTGTKEGETDGEGWSGLLHPADRERADKVWRAALASGEPYETQYRLYHAPTKTYRWVIGRALPYRDKTGAISKWYGTCTDIDEQKRSAQMQVFLGNVSKELTAAALDKTELLRKVTSACVPAVADWCSVDFMDTESVIHQASIAHIDEEKAAKARKYRDMEPMRVNSRRGVPAVIRSGKTAHYPVVTSRILEQIVSGKDKLQFMQGLGIRSIIIAPLTIKDATVGAISFVSAESGRHYSDSDKMMIEELAARISLALTNSQLYEDAQRELAVRHALEKELLLEKQKLESRVKERTQQLLVVNEGLRREIDKRKRVEDELHKKSENLERSNRELEDFAYVASHDLQEPLRKIQAFSDLLMSEYKEVLGEGGDYVMRMNTAASRMSTLIQDLLAFSRVATQDNPPQDVDLDGVVADVLSDLEARIEAVGGRVTVGELPHVLADPTHMRQLFQNLIGNALKFHKPGEKPSVAVSAKRLKDTVEISVVDNGIGFDEKYIDKIFSVFQRLHGRDSFEGTGIGLAVCRKIVERYDGSVTATSEKDVGSTFIVQLPYKQGRKSI